MQVLIVSQYFWPERFRVNDLASALKDRGHQVTVLTGRPNYPEGRFFAGYGFWGPARDEFEGIPIVRVPLVPRGRVVPRASHSTTSPSPSSRACWARRDCASHTT